MTESVATVRQSLARQTMFVFVASLALLFGLGGWAVATEFAGAVIASGQIVVESNVKRIQHPTGGIVGELRVRDGLSVKAGDVLIRLDDLQPRTNLAIVSKALDELLARQARLEAERDAADDVSLPAVLVERLHEFDVAQIVTGETRQFHMRRSSREGQRGQLRERMAQLNKEISGYAAQHVSKHKQLDWITEELAGVHELWSKKLVPFTRVTNLERERERLAGDLGQLEASMAQSTAKIAETQLQILQIDQDMRAEVGKELADIRARISELVEKRTAAQDQLQRIDIRSPQDGVVHQLTVHTLGGVIAPGEQIMLIVPEADILTVEARLFPHDIDQVYLGQPSIVRLSAFNQQTTPELHGIVARRAADAIEDAKSGSRFYTVRVTIPDAELSRLGNLKLMPGMPAEVFIQTQPRTVISFLIRPLLDQVGRAFRES